MEDNLSYYRRRTAEELAAADQSPSAAIAAVHLSLAERYAALAGNSQPIAGSQQALLSEP